MKKLLLALILLPGLCFAKLDCEAINIAWRHDLYRCEVPSGWLIESQLSVGYSVTFVPDKNHEWRI